MAPNTVARPRIGSSHVDQLSIPDIIIISPISLGRGGRPSLAAQDISHQIGSRVVMVLKPRVINIFRVWVRSYRRLARPNRAEDTSPWAIIRIRAPLIAHWVPRMAPPATSLICPTEE